MDRDTVVALKHPHEARARIDLETHLREHSKVASGRSVSLSLSTTIAMYIFPSPSQCSSELSTSLRDVTMSGRISAASKRADSASHEGMAKPERSNFAISSSMAGRDGGAAWVSLEGPTPILGCAKTATALCRPKSARSRVVGDENGVGHRCPESPLHGVAVCLAYRRHDVAAETPPPPPRVPLRRLRGGGEGGVSMHQAISL
jgi:hypothetical protein